MYQKKRYFNRWAKLKQRKCGFVCVCVGWVRFGAAESCKRSSWRLRDDGAVCHVSAMTSPMPRHTTPSTYPETGSRVYSGFLPLRLAMGYREGTLGDQPGCSSGGFRVRFLEFKESNPAITCTPHLVQKYRCAYKSPVRCISSLYRIHRTCLLMKTYVTIYAMQLTSDCQ